MKFRETLTLDANTSLIPTKKHKIFVPPLKKRSPQLKIANNPERTDFSDIFTTNKIPQVKTRQSGIELFPCLKLNYSPNDRINSLTLSMPQLQPVQHSEIYMKIRDNNS